MLPTEPGPGPSSAEPAASSIAVQPGEMIAGTQTKFEAYAESIPGTDLTFQMVPIPGGTFQMGSPATEAGRNEDEGPQCTVNVSPFWMGVHEVTWDAYDVWSYATDTAAGVEGLDGVTRPTPPYTDMTFGMGHDGYPAICMTQVAARAYCAWLTKTTGHVYRLPTEAEWEYACRAGTTTAYSFGDDPTMLDEYAWHAGNCDAGKGLVYQPVGGKKPNPWGLHDMHGNVMEWTLDAYGADFYAAEMAQPRVNPFHQPKRLFPRTARGGSFMDDAALLRSAARKSSRPAWKQQDPQIPKSKWYHTDALFLGFRVVRVVDPEATREQALHGIAPNLEPSVR